MNVYMVNRLTGELIEAPLDDYMAMSVDDADIYLVSLELAVAERAAAAIVRRQEARN
jgi:hypothetical protein